MQLNLVQETRKAVSGPVPVQEFIDSFLPTGSIATVKPKSLKAPFSKVAKQAMNLEKKMYGPIETALGPFLPGFKVKKTADQVNPKWFVHGHNVKPDLAVFNETGLKTGLEDMELYIEVKRDKNEDPFKDRCKSASGFVRDVDIGRKTLGQLISYAIPHLGAQFRCFGYSMLIAGTYARLIRWDRAGAVVSARFDYTKDHKLLTEFCWRFAHASKEDRGIDTSVRKTEISEFEQDKIREFLGMADGEDLYEYDVVD
ncbi:hypothetical protein CONPUDRAFT_108190, partial [Coniophora puteana RWD-64-598 SS2]